MTKRKKTLPQHKPGFVPSRQRIERMKAQIRAENERQSDTEMVRDFLPLGDEDDWVEEPE